METIPESVQEYAKENAFPHFLEMTTFLALPESVNVKDLVLGKGYAVYNFGDVSKSESFSDLIGEKSHWLYLVTTSDGVPISFIRVRFSENGLTSGGGGEARFFVETMNKMTELIRLYGGNEEPVILQYSNAGFLFAYEFDNDWRVMNVNTASVDERLLSVTDYHQLPTGEETVQAVRDEYERWQKILAQDDSAMGGFDLKLPVHDFTTMSNNQTSRYNTAAIMGGSLRFHF